MNDKNIANAAEQFEMGRRYYNGEGVEQDYTHAALWYMEAAEQGHAKAQFNLGMCYRNGEGAEKDGNQAAYWLKKAARQGDAEAMYNLAILRETMLCEEILYKDMLWWEEVEYIPQTQKLREGLLWLILAAKQEHTEAQKLLNEMRHINYALVDMKADDLIALAGQGEIKGLADYGGRYFSNAGTPVGAARLKLIKSEMPPYSHLKSHFNGQPYFEEGERWPAAKDGKMLDFVFQIFNTDDFGLPGKIKLIQFYYDLKKRPYSAKADGWLVKIYENINLDKAVIIDPGYTRSYYYCEIEFEPISPKAKNSNFCSQVGGRPRWLQGDISPNDFQFLFQLDCETEAGLYWGDVGMVYAYYDPNTKETWFDLQSC